MASRCNTSQLQPFLVIVVVIIFYYCYYYYYYYYSLFLFIFVYHITEAIKKLIGNVYVRTYQSVKSAADIWSCNITASIERGTPSRNSFT